MKIATLFFCIIPLLAGCEKLDINKNCLNSLSSCFKQDKTAPSVESSQAFPDAGPTVSLLTGIQVNFSEELSDLTNKSKYELSGNGAADLQIASVDKLSASSVRVNLTGSVSNNLISLSFPGLTDYGGNKLVAGSSITLQGNVDIPIQFDDAGRTYYVSSAASGATRVLSAVIHWRHLYDKNANNAYQVKIGGSKCADAPTTVATGASIPSGMIAANTPITTTIPVASQFSTPGSYTLRFCVTNDEMNKSGEDSVTVISIDTPPVVSADLGAGSYGAAKTVTFSCGNYCNRIAYNLASGNPAGTPPNPAFGAGGTTANTLMTSPWLTPHAADPWITNIKLIAYDFAGNQSGILSLAYTIDINIPNISFGSPAVTNPYISQTGNNPAVIRWNSDKAGNFLICRGGTGCGTTPNCVGGTALTTAQPYPPASLPIGVQAETNVPAIDLVAGANTIHICFSTGVQVGDATRTVTVDNQIPTLASATPLDGAISLSPSTGIQVTFTENIAMDASTLQPSGASTCTGGIQLSKDFSTNVCIPMGSFEQVSATVFRVKPLQRLEPGVYKLRIAGTVKDIAGNAFAGFTQPTGFGVNGLLRQFTFNNDATSLNDQSGTIYHLTSVGTPQKVPGVDGDANGAYRFDGTGNQYLTGADTGLPAGNSPQTLCAWINPAVSNSSFAMAAGYGDTDWVYLGTHSGLQVNAGHASSSNTDGTSLPLNTWVHLCVAYTGAVQTVYVNGILDSTQTLTSRFTTLNSLKIGKQPSASLAFSYFFHGRVDDVRVYAGALTAADIRQMAIQVPNGLLAYYSFSDAASGTAIDYSGNGHTGLRNGAPLPTITTDRFGVTGAYTFGGPSQYINAPDTGLPSGNAPRTMCSWIRPTTLPGSGQIRVAVRYGTPGTGQETYIGLHNNSGQQTVIFSSGNDHLIAAYPIATATWMNLCGSYDGTTAKIYANGQLLASAPKTWNTVLLGSNNGILIGQRDLTGTYVFPGAIDDVRIYNRVLSDNEILALSSQLGIGLLRQYSFTGGVTTDDTGNAPLTQVGTPTLVSGFDGTASSAYSFNGSDTQAFTASDAGLPSGNSPRTICAALTSVTDCAGNICMATMYGTTGNGPYLGIWQGKAAFGAYGGLDYRGNTDISGSLGVWRHVCSTYDGSTVSVFLNGQPDGTQASSWSTVLGGAAGLSIGKASSSAGFSFNGSVDNVRVYNRVLSIAEIQELQGY